MSDLLRQHQHEIAELTLVTGTRGVFDVVVDGTLLYSKAATGRHAHDGEILELFTQFVGGPRASER